MTSARATDGKSRFVDEISEGVMVHAKTTTPSETYLRFANDGTDVCRYQSGNMRPCPLGYECSDEVVFYDKTHKDGFLDNSNRDLKGGEREELKKWKYDSNNNADKNRKEGEGLGGLYCNCWINKKLENYWIPRLEEVLGTIVR